MSVIDTAEYRRLALIAAGVDPSQIPPVIDTATWRRLMIGALAQIDDAVGDASALTTGTLADARLSSNVPLLDAANTFSANQTLNGTNNVAPNQTAASGSSIMTRDLVDARAGQSIRLVLASDVSVANNTTLADVSGMSATLEAATYTFVGYVRFTASVSQVFKYRFNYTGTLSSALAHGMYYSDTSSAMLGALRGVNNTITSNSRTLWVESYMGSMLLTTGGDFSFQFAQNASSADAVVIKAGSFLMLVKQ